jgi:polyisoprenoid-binding protein YceI
MATASPKDVAQIGGGTWTIDPNHSLIEFATRHFDVAWVKGRFRSYSGKVEVDPDDLLKSRVELSIDTGSVDSGAVQGREDLIRGEEMLEADKYPTITFRSTRIEQSGDGRFLVTGDLTLHGTTRQVQVPMEFGGFAQTRMGPRAGFSGQLKLSRQDFGVPFNREFEPGRAVVSDEVRIELQIEVTPASS